MERDGEDELTEALRSVLAQLTDARRKAEWLLETALAPPPTRERGASPTVRRPAPSS
jgi:hypothetical protein